MKTDSDDQQPDISDRPKQIKFNNFLEQIKEEQRNLDMKLFSKYFSYGRPDRMIEVLYASKSRADNNSVIRWINDSFDYFANKVKEMPKDARTEQVKILKIVYKILNFNGQNQQGSGLKMLTSNQMLSRLPISLAQLIAGYNSKNLKNEINYFILCTDYKNLQKKTIKVLLTLYKD